MPSLEIRPERKQVEIPLERIGNAREARKLFEKLRKVQSQRLRGLGRQPTVTELQTLTADDVRAAVDA